MNQRKVWFVEGNIKTGKGVIAGILPYDDITLSNHFWQFSISGISFVSKTNISQSIYISTNLLQDVILTSSSQREIWNPYIHHLRLSGLSNSHSLPILWNPITSLSANVEFYIFNVLDKKPYILDAVLSLTVLFQKTNAILSF